MKFFIILIAFVGFCLTGFSQTIINAERYMNGEDSTVIALAFSYNGTRGNSNTNMMDISPAVLYLKGKNEFKVFGGYNLLSGSGVGLLNSGYFHIRHNYRLGKRLKTFAFYQWQFNDVLLIDKREVLGVGLRYEVFSKRALKSNFSLGPMREVEVLDGTTLLPDEITETKFTRLNLVNSTSIAIGKKAKIDNVFYFQPYFSEFKDFRMLNDFNFSISISPHLSVLTLLSTRFDSKPPSVLNKFDNILSFGFSVKI